MTDIPGNQDEWKIVSRKKTKGLVLSHRINGNCEIIKKRKLEELRQKVKESKREKNCIGGKK